MAFFDFTSIVREQFVLILCNILSALVGDAINGYNDAAHYLLLHLFVFCEGFRYCRNEHQVFQDKNADLCLFRTTADLWSPCASDHVNGVCNIHLVIDRSTPVTCSAAQHTRGPRRQVESLTPQQQRRH